MCCLWLLFFCYPSYSVHVCKRRKLHCHYLFHPWLCPFRQDTCSPRCQGPHQVASLPYSGHITPLASRGLFPHSLYFSRSISDAQCVFQNLSAYIFFIFFLFIIAKESPLPSFFVHVFFFGGGRYLFLFFFLYCFLCRKNSEIQSLPQTLSWDFLEPPKPHFLICKMKII